MKTHLPVILSIILYLLIFWLRYQQGGWEINLDLFPKLRQNLDLRIAQLLPSPQAELLSGILLGNKKDLPGRLKLALRDSSTLHIVVVSGQNLTLVAGLFLNLAGVLKRKTAIFISIGAIIFYTLLTGGQIPVIRAAIMALLSFTAQIFGRVKSGIWVLILTAGLLLLINPKWLFDLSFQLSFLATMGVIALAPILERYLKRLPEIIKLDLAITIGAQIMVMPIIAQNFHQISLVGIFSNLLVGWTVPFIMVLGSIMLVGSIVSAAVAWFLALTTSAFLTYFIYIVQFFASLPFAWEYVGEQLWIVWIGYYLVLASIVLSLNYGKTEDSRRSEKSN